MLSAGRPAELVKHRPFEAAFDIVDAAEKTLTPDILAAVSAQPSLPQCRM
jgi:hypothetical protein